MRRALPLLIMIFLCFSCSKLTEHDKGRVKSALADSLTRKTESWGVEMNLIESGDLRVDLSAPYASTRQLDNGTVTHFKGPVHIAVYDTTGKVVTTITCGRAAFRSRKSTFEFYDNVVVATNRKRTLRTEYLKWMQNNHHIETKDYVTITTPSDSIAGYGLTGSDDLKSYVVTKVTGRVAVD